MLGWILAVGNHVIEMRREIEGEEKLRGTKAKLAERHMMKSK